MNFLKNSTSFFPSFPTGIICDFCLNPFPDNFAVLHSNRKNRLQILNCGLFMDFVIGNAVYCLIFGPSQ